MMPRVTVADFQFSERAAAKMWEHGIHFHQLSEVLNHPRFAVRNRKNHAADYLLIGRDNSGRCITIPMLPTDNHHLWRPITAWYCKPSEAAKLR
ncbi:MAG: hypothetical protein K0Q71_4902 [Thermomicrobiales bacterium]|nr:hypothetical protein [Thermomicrobiales bacterium]